MIWDDVFTIILLYRAAQKDRAAFDEVSPLIRRYIEPIVARHLPSSAALEDRDDIVQEVLLRVWAGLPKMLPPQQSYSSGRSFASQLRRIARNRALDSVLLKRAPPTLEIDASVIENIVDPTGDPAQHVADKLFMSRALTSLSAEDRDILHLRFSEELSNRQIAQAYNIHEIHAAHKIYWALKKLRGIVASQDTASPAPPEVPDQDSQRREVPRFVDVKISDERWPGTPVKALYYITEENYYRLEVAIRCRPEGVAEHGGRRQFPALGEHKMVALLVVLDSEDFIIETVTDFLVLPPSGDSTRAAFFRVRPRTKPTKTYRARIRATIFYQFNIVEEFDIVALMAWTAPPHAWWDKFGRSNSIAITNHQRILEYDELARLPLKRLNILVRSANGKYNLTFNAPRGGYRQLLIPTRIDISVDELEDYLVRLRIILDELALIKTDNTDIDPGSYRFAYVEGTRDLAKLGRDLWTLMFEREADSPIGILGRWLTARPMPDDSVIQVVLDETATDFVFPWNMLYDREPESTGMPDINGFWGARYCIEQLILPYASPQPDVSPVPNGINLGMYFWRFPLTKTQSIMFSQFSGQSNGRLVVPAAGVTDAESAYVRLRSCFDDISYFFAHGAARIRSQATRGAQHREFAGASRPETRLGPEPQPSDQSTNIELTYGRITVEELYRQIPAKYAQSHQRAPLVFLNLCDSAQFYPNYRDGFVRCFLTRGAAAVIGTECSIPPSIAHSFSEVFFKEFFAGERIYTAILRARRTLLKEMNPLGLAYSVYGTASLRISPPCIEPVEV